MKKKLIIQYPLLIFLIINSLAFILLYYFWNNNFSKYIIFKTILLIILIWIPYLIKKSFKIEFPKLLYYLYYLLIAVDLLLGKIMLFEHIIPYYDYLVLIVQGVIFYVFGLWLVRFIDDYGFLNLTIILLFSFFFSITLSLIKEVIYYFILSFFDILSPNHIINLLVTMIGSIIAFGLIIIDKLYYKNKYLKLLEGYLK